MTNKENLEINKSRKSISDNIHPVYGFFTPIFINYIPFVFIWKSLDLIDHKLQSDTTNGCLLLFFSFSSGFIQLLIWMGISFFFVFNKSSRFLGLSIIYGAALFGCIFYVLLFLKCGGNIH